MGKDGVNLPEFSFSTCLPEPCVRSHETINKGTCLLDLDFLRFCTAFAAGDACLLRPGANCFQTVSDGESSSWKQLMNTDLHYSRHLPLRVVVLALLADQQMQPVHHRKHEAWYKEQMNGVGLRDITSAFER